jgi:hypothetical protein
MMNAQTLERHDLETTIIQRSSSDDDAFRKEFTTDPKGAFAVYLQVPAASEISRLIWK